MNGEEDLCYCVWIASHVARGDKFGQGIDIKSVRKQLSEQPKPHFKSAKFLLSVLGEVKDYGHSKHQRYSFALLL